MVRSSSTVGLTVLSLLCTTSHGATIRVPADQPTIQAGINAAADGDTVLVAPGTYVENINFVGKRVHLSSVLGADSTTVSAASTSIAVVSFISSEPKGAELRGFTITGSNRTGILCIGSSPTIRDNIVTGNSSSSGDDGAGADLISTTGALVAGNVFHGNTANTYGRSVHIRGGVNDTISRNIMYGNSGYQEIRSMNSTTLVANNTLIGPGSGWAIQGLSGANVIAVNNIIYGQYGACFSAYTGVVTASYNCIWDYILDFDGPQMTVGPGNIYADPEFADTASRDYRLTLSSACIDAGDPSSPLDPDGTRADIGALHFPWAFGLLRVDTADSTHVVDSAPALHWSVLRDTGTQEAFEVQVGTNDDWALAEMWSSGEVSSTDTFTVYAGIALEDGATYFARMRGRMGGNWSGWNQTMFRMNSLPIIPTPVSPLDTAEVDTNPPTFTTVVGPDAEADSQQLQFAIFHYDSLIVEESPLVPPIPAPEGDTVTWAGTVPLLENGSYIWAVRTFDGYEYTSYWSAWRVFFVNAIQEAPSIVDLRGPETDSIVYSQHPDFAWTPSADPDPNDTVQYNYRISIDSLFAFARAVDSLNDTTYADSVALETGRRYWWKVHSRDNSGLTAESEVAQFRTYKPGDVDKSWSVTSADIIALVLYVFKSTPLPAPECAGRANLDQGVNASDVIAIVNFVFKGGEAPLAGCD